MPRAINKFIFSIFVLLAQSTSSQALTFKNLNYDSYQGRPLRITIEVENATSEKIESLEIRVGEQRLLQKLGLNDSDIWDDIRVGISPLVNGTSKILIESKKPVQVKTIDFLAEFRWSGGELVKSHSFDIPNMSPKEFTINWAEEWASGNIDGYLAKYSKEFEPPSGLSREAWEIQRRQRTTPDLNIQITLKDIKVHTVKNKSTIEFLQLYQSRIFESQTNKKLNLVLENNEWRIIKEIVK